DARLPHQVPPRLRGEAEVGQVGPGGGVTASLSTRALVAIAFLSIVLLALVGRTPTADAQPAAQPGIRVIDPAAAQPAPDRPTPKVIGVGSDRAHRDKTQGSGTGMAILFWAFALGTIGGSIFVITRRNL